MIDSIVSRLGEVALPLYFFIGFILFVIIGVIALRLYRVNKIKKVRQKAKEDARRIRIRELRRIENQMSYFNQPDDRLQDDGRDIINEGYYRSKWGDAQDSYDEEPTKPKAKKGLFKRKNRGVKVDE